MGRKMKEKVQLLTIVGGFILYVGDLIFDWVVCVQYGLNQDFWWFFITLCFIVLPSILVNSYAVSQMKYYGMSDKCYKMKCVAIYLANCGMVYRYLQEFRQWKKVNYDKTQCGKSNQSCCCEECCEWYSSEKEKSLKSALSMAKLRYMETITESAPQWCLQTYIMLRQWNFPWYTVVSVVLSLLSLAWSITTLEKARELKENHNFNLITTVSFLIWQLASLISRLSAIVILAYVHRYYVFIFFVINWLLNLLLVLVVMQVSKKVASFYSICIYKDANPQLFQHKCYTIIIISYSVLFHISNFQITLLFLYDTDIYKRYMTSGNVFLALGNIIMLTLSVTIENPYAPYMPILKQAAISLVVGALLISCVFYVAYSTCWYPETKDDDQMSKNYVNEGFEESVQDVPII